MLTSNFRELLAVKAKAYQNLDLLRLVKSLSASTLEEYIIESLEKMAKLSSHVGRNPNSGLLAFAGSMQNDDVHMLKDALSHHVSRYKSALKDMHASTDQNQRRKLRGIADQHLSRIVPLAHLAARAEPHSDGRISADLPPIRAWQANYTGHHKFKDYPAIRTHPDGKISVMDPVRDHKEYTGRPNAELIGTEGWGGRPSSAGRTPGHNHNNSRSTPDYRYLEMPINQNHPEALDTHHRGGFPFEDMRIGSADEVASGGGHIHVEDIPNIDSYVPHEFDVHPINSIFDIPDSKFTDAQKTKFASDFSRWKDSPNYENFLNRHEALEASDPDAYNKRGSSKPEHHFEGIPLIKQPRHAMAPDEIEEPSPENIASDHLISYIDPMSPPDAPIELPSSKKQVKTSPAYTGPEDIPYSPGDGAKTNVVRRPAEIVPSSEQAPARPSVIRRPAEAVPQPQQTQAKVQAESSSTDPDKLPEKFKGAITQKDWNNLSPALRAQLLKS